MRHFITALSLVAIGLSKAIPALPNDTPADNAPYTLPDSDPDPTARAAAINYKRANFLYGPPLGAGPYFPSGSLGNATAAADLASLTSDAATITPDLNADQAAAIAGEAQVGITEKNTFQSD